MENVSRAVRAFAQLRLSQALRIASGEAAENAPTAPPPRVYLTVVTPRPCPECRGSGEVEREGKAGVYVVACRCRSSELPGGAR